MLGTRVIMLGMSQLPGSNNEQNDAEVICAANHNIPVFWLLLFAPSDIQLFETQNIGQESLDSSGVQHYPVLLTERSVAIKRLSERKKTLSPLMSDSDSQLLDRWMDFLQHNGSPVIAVDTYELWNNMAEPEKLQQELTALLDEFNPVDFKPETLQKLKASAHWQENNAISLAGFGW